MMVLSKLNHQPEMLVAEQKFVLIQKILPLTLWVHALE
jgi:hypothetical protein